MCACHPCAGAMLIFSASLQFQRMIPEGNPQRGLDVNVLCCLVRAYCLTLVIVIVVVVVVVVVVVAC